MQKFLLAFVALLLFLPNLYKADVNPVLPYDGKEKFDPSLSYLHSISLLERYTDSIASSKNIAENSYEYVELLEFVIEQRFYHGFSHYTPAENWIAALGGRFIRQDLACKVQPEEIMKHNNAACSQQALVMMAVLRNKKIDYRSLGFPHHYAIEVKLGNEWYFFDANMEPGITKEQRLSTQWQYQNDNLKKYYDTNRHTNLDYQFGNKQTATVGAVNEVPAKNATLFHCVTGIISTLGWLFPLVLIFIRGGFNVEVPFVALLFKRSKPMVSLPA